MKKNPLNYDFIFNKELLFDTNINKNIKESDDYIDDEFEDKDKEVIGNNNAFNKHCKNNKDSHSDAEIEQNNFCSSNERSLIDLTFIDYKKKYSNNNKTWWPVNVSYGGKKYYVSSHSSYLNNPKKSKILL